MTDLLLHPKTSKQIEALLNRPPHGLIITGENGSGKDTVARRLAASLLGIEYEKLEQYPYVLTIETEDSYISIEQVRQLQQFLKLKVPSDKGINRILIIPRAGRMRHEAQNALLKTLEEPPAGTVLILTAESTDRLLPTITSRCRELPVMPVSLARSREYFAARGVSEAQLTSIHALSMGQAGLMASLLSEEAHPLIEQVDLAKKLLGMSPGKRLMMAESLGKDRDAARALISAIRRITHAGIAASGRKPDTAAVSKWLSRQSAAIKSSEYLEKNANVKLLLADLFIKL